MIDAAARPTVQQLLKVSCCKKENSKVIASLHNLLLML